ncbi:MAG: hypothetical protein BGO68_03055 [Candidatus Amoebophilus sp. 36-38]|nr:MAG: hypothetical protein BGO68_03055 [Candidatus Amoebophilus sp. 36-38]
MRQRLEIEIPDKKYQQEVQRKAHKIVEETLNEILESILSAEIPADVVISLDDLHIDLAEIDQNLLEENIVQKIQHKLPLIVKEQVSLAIQDPLKKRITPLPEAKLKAIKHYLGNGYFAWWMPTNTTNDEKFIEDLYLDIYHETPTLIKDLWTELGQELSAIQRFLSQFSFPTIQKSIKLLSPKYADQILDIAEDIKRLQAILFKMAHIPHHKKLYTTTAHIVLAHAMQILSSNKKFNETIFLESCLQKIAHELKTTYSALVTTLVRELPQKHAITKTLKSNLFNHIIHLHESRLSNKHKFKQAATQLPLLIREFDHLLAQGEKVDKRQLSTSINQVFEHANTPPIKDILRGHFQSSEHIHRLPQLLSTKDFEKFIEVTQPSISKSFRMIKQLWESVVAQQNGKSKLVEELTIKYWNKELSQQQGLDKYINYMIRKLELYEPGALEKWHTSMQKSKAALAEAYSPELVNLLLTSLETTHPSPNGFQADLARPTTTVGNLLIRALHQVQMDAAITLGSPLADLMSNLYHQISLTVERKEPLTPTLEKEITSKLNELLQRTINNKNQLNWATAEVESWLHQQASQSSINNGGRGLEVLKKELGVTLSKLVPLTLPQIKEFFTDQLLFPGYPNQGACMVAVVKHIISLPIRKTEVFTLLKQTSIRKQLAKKMEPSARKILMNILTPLDADTKETYQQLLLRADILRASTYPDKQALLDEIFIEVASKNPQLSEDHFIQHSLLSFSYNAQLSKSEIYRRVCIAAQKYAPNTTISNKLQELTVLFAQNNQEAADPLDSTFLPIYHLLTSFIASPSLAAKLYVELLDFLKKTIRHRLPSSTIDKQLQQKINDLFGMLSAHQKQKLFETIKKELEKIAAVHEQDLENAWIHFLKTGELDEAYNNPRQLFNALLGTNIQQVGNTTPTSLATNLTTTQLEKLAQEFKTTIQTTLTRKRLIASLPTPELEKVVYLIAKDKARTLIDRIHGTQDLWEYAGASTLSHQETKLAWWDAALLSLVKTEKNAKSERDWLADSLTNFSKSLVISSYTLVSILTTATKTFKLANQTTAEIEKLQTLGNQLRDIQQSWERSNRQEAKKSWPNEPILQNLHQLFTIGFSSLAGHPATSLEQLEQQLTTLIQQQHPQVKKFFFSYADPIVASQKIVHYFSTPLIKQIIKTLDSKASPFIQKYLEFHTFPQIDFYNENKIDPLSWYKYMETASLAYLLKKQDKNFNQEKYLEYTLDLLNTYTKQKAQPIVQRLIDHYTENNNSSPYTQLIQELQTILSREAKKPSEENLSHDQMAINEPLTDVHQKSVRHQPEEEKEVEKQHDANKEPIKDIKIYVKNSGLIFLWPFLEELLQKQGLLVRQKFIDKIDRNNAVHALQYLVTESLFTSDWHITLNKLLCGMVYNDIAFTGYYLREERNFAKIVIEERKKALASAKSDQDEPEKATTFDIPEEIIQLKKHAEELLKTVLEKWESLKKLEKFEPYKQGFGIQDLRQYILQRDGILQYIHQEGNQGYWHLTISWEEYDAEINKKLPWSINKIRLPFMKEDLVVFWLPD